MRLSLTRGRSLTTLAAAAILVLAASLPASARSMDEIANLTGPDRQKILEEGAKKEGAVQLLGGLNEQHAARPILKAFMAKYPFIDGKTVRSDTSQTLQRVLAEHRGRNPTLDVIFSSIVTDLREAGLVQAIKSPALDAYAAAEKDPKGLWQPLNYNFHGLAAYNTNQVKDAEAPKKIEDLLDPKWKGKMSWGASDSTGAPFLFTYLRESRGEDFTVGFLEKLAKQDVITRSSSIRNVLDLVIAGENPIMIAPALHHIGEAKAAKAPVSVTIIDPLIARPGYFLVLKSAPHPHAALLMADFLLGAEAQAILAEGKYFPAHPKVDAVPEMRPFQPSVTGQKVFVMDDDMMFKNSQRSNELLDKYFR